MIDFTVSVSAAEERRLKEFISALRTNCKVEMNPKWSDWKTKRDTLSFL